MINSRDEVVVMILHEIDYTDDQWEEAERPPARHYAADIVRRLTTAYQL